MLWGRLPEPIRQYVKNKTLLAISDCHPLIRATVGIIITTIVVHEGIAQWPALLPTLCNMLDGSDENLQEVFFLNIHLMICVIVLLCSTEYIKS